MNTERYKKEHESQALSLIKRTENFVTPTEYYSGVPQLIEDPADGKALGNLFKKAFTVVAMEEGELVGLASMDKQGNLGLLCVDGQNKKAAKLLIRALERLAVKKSVAQIGVVPAESALKIFKECGYSQKEGAEKSLEGSGEFLFKTIIAEKPPIEFPPEMVKRIILDGRKPITVEGKVSIFPPLFFGIASFFIILLTILGVAAKLGSANVYGAENIPVLAVVFGLLFVAALTIFILYLVRNYRLKKQVLSMTVTYAVITGVTSDAYWTRDSDGDRERYEQLYLYYAYYDENMVLRKGSFTSKYKHRAPYFYEGQELVVACSGELSYILCKYTVLSTEGGETEEPEVVAEERQKRPRSKKVSDPYAYAPVADRKIYFIISGAVFGMLAVAVGAVSFFEYLASVQTGRTFWETIKFAWPFLAFAVVTLGGIGAFYISLPLAARAKYKKLLSTDVKFAAGKLTCADKTYRADNKNRFYCEYVTEDGETKSVSVAGIHVADMVKHGKTNVTVAYNQTTAVILIKK